MSSVYKARQSGLNRIVALKVLPSEMAALPGFGPRFQREAQAMARLNHPNIVGIHDFGINEDGQYYLVMEFVDGAGLDQVIRDGPVPPDDALAMIPQICEALQFAHESGIVHRDIEPGNILLNKSGQIKVADFGLAKMVSEENADMSLTSTGYILGTPDYMAPEQFEGGDKVDHRADLYALGTVFYQLLTGELPRGAYELPSQKIQVDVRLDEVVIKALEREPELRYQNASEVKSDLEAIRDSAHQAGLPRRKRMLIPSLFAIGILLGVVGLGLWIGGSVAMGPKVTSSQKEYASHAQLEDTHSVKPIEVDPSLFPLPYPTRPSEKGRFASFRRGYHPPSHLGMPRSITAADPPPEVSFRTDLVDLAVSTFKPTGTVQQSTRRDHILALASDGTVFAWGGNDYGECEVPSDLEDIAVIDAGIFNSHALSSNGYLTVWGRAQHGACEVPETIQGRIVAIAAGEQHTLALTSDGKVAAWGNPASGKTTVPDGLNGVVAISAGSTHSMALRADGSLVSWGDNTRGQLRPGDTVPPLKKIANIGLNSFGLDINGTYHDWGAMELLKGDPSAAWPDEDDRFLDLDPGMLSIFALQGTDRRWRLFGKNPEVLPEPFQHSPNLVVGINHIYAIIDPESDYVEAEKTPITNSLGMEFLPVSVEGGLEDGRLIFMCTHETRVADYREFVRSTNRENWPSPSFAQGEDHPAVNVSWNEAVAFCEWLTQSEIKKGELEDDWQYRLPTDYEWSWAVGEGHFEEEAAPTVSKNGARAFVPWGEPFRLIHGSVNLYGAENEGQGKSTTRKSLPGFQDDFPFTSPVKSYEPNGYCLYDLGGNVREW